ncbi:hypothetical protein CDL15_Pgr023053 [Punica granatum]|uniref:KIB1-4 beta-propeller domain-containing protein n=1 Tax=Punica granatum TaxID=22663 RepID=A0A218X566_PUNGR|nr:hypothetical protein CDL15_Pgr023053 [Punica granatum]PKI72449.1 hypothetical protein CRG98_007195 [Punica granatum]
MVDTRCVNWLDLPRELLYLILDKLIRGINSDYFRFAVVCKDWLAVAREFQATSPKRQLFPILLIPTEDKSKTHRGWYDVIQDRIVDSRLHVPYNRRCCGSSHGWLIFTEEDLSLTLYNPFAGKSIRLPPVIPVPPVEELSADHQYDIPKVVLSADPFEAPDTYEVVAIHGVYVGKLAYFKSGWNTWIYARQGEYNMSDWTSHFCEITYFDGKSYAADDQSLVSLEVCISEADPNASSYVSLNLIMIRQRNWVSKCYLVPSLGGRLLWIDRHHRWKNGSFEMDGKSYDYDPDILHLTKCFKVYEMKEIDGQMNQVELTKLDGQAIFVGNNHAEMIMTSLFPAGCKPNRIYYTDDNMDRVLGPYQPLGAIDIGVFDLDKECTYPLCVPGESKKDMPPPIWFVPRASHIRLANRC